MTRIDQVLPSLASRDAIGVHTRNIKAALQARGIESHIYYGTCTPDVADDGEPILELTRPVPDRVVLYHASIGSPVFDYLGMIDSPIAVDYHNITPAPLLERWEPSVAHELVLGRRQLAELASASILGLADSDYNRRELVDLGYSPTKVAPLLIDMRHAAPEVDEGLKSRLLAEKHGRSGPSLLYVGKLSPHKAPHDLVAMLAAYRALYDDSATLTLVGSPLGDRYRHALESFIVESGQGDRVTIAGSLSGAELEAYWQTTDVFVSASDHEGFCVPLVEAMGHGVPVVAYGTAAVPETIADAGLAIASKEPIAFAAAVHRVVTDAPLREQLIGAGLARLDHFDLEVATTRFIEALLGPLGLL